MIGLAIFVRHHAHDFIAFHFGFERATHATVRAGSDRAVLRLTHHDHGFFSQRRGRAGLYAGAAGHAIGFHEAVILTGSHARIKSAAIDSQSKGTLGLFAGTYATVADNALRCVISEVGI